MDLTSNLVGVAAKVTKTSAHLTGQALYKDSASAVALQDTSSITVKTSRLGCAATERVVRLLLRPSTRTLGLNQNGTQCEDYGFRP